MRRGVGIFAIVSIALSSSVASAELPKLTKQSFANFHDEFSGWDISSDRTLLLRHWQANLKAAFLAPDPDRAARILAPKYDFSVSDMRELIELWVSENNVGLPDETPAAKNAIHALNLGLVHLAKKTRYKPLAIEAAAQAIAPFGDCDAGEFNALVQNAPDPFAVGWIAAQSSFCADWMPSLVALAPKRSFGPLLLTAQESGLLKSSDDLALYAYLNGDSSLAHVDPADRTIAHAHLAFEYAELLWKAGLIPQGIAFVEQLPPEVRTLLLNGKLGLHEIHADGVGIWLEADGGGPQYWKGDELVREESSSDYIRLMLAGAYFVSGRTAEAEKAFASIEMTEKARRDLSCALRPLPKPSQFGSCSRTTPSTADVLLLDHLLRHSDEDPYNIAETFYSSNPPESTDGPIWADIACQAFSESKFRTICTDARIRQVGSTRSTGREDAHATASLAAIRAAGVPNFDASRAKFQKSLNVPVVHFGGKGFDDVRQQRLTKETALPPRFAAMPLPDKYRGQAATEDKSWLKSLAPLPRGYELVRVERDGQRVVAISVSQNYDPTGEVSRGGYWVHLSDDGGKTWQSPLYTGLADLWPYVVLPDSKMPLIDGDTLDVAVDVQELDTESITYPPIALRSLRRETNLYVKIPLAELKRDSLGDGMTDIAREHLLLTPHAPGGSDNQTPLLVGTGLSAKCRLTKSPEQKAIALLLEKVFSVHTGAIIEPVDRDAHSIDAMMKSEMAAAARRDPNSVDRPMFLLGDPADFACLQPDRMMIVYGEADVALLRRLTPDFHAVSLSKIVFNRAHDRGYVSWSKGWSGGTDRLRLVSGEWVLEEISSWIT